VHGGEAAFGHALQSLQAPLPGLSLYEEFFQRQFLWFRRQQMPGAAAL
jgi:hypothetical protein